MEFALSDVACPSCLQRQGVEHIEVQPVDDRLQLKDRRLKVDFTYLSLIAAERRQSGRDRRAISSDKVTVEHPTHASMVCLNCAHEWGASDRNHVVAAP